MYQRKKIKALNIIKKHVKNNVIDLIWSFAGDPKSSVKVIYDILMTGNDIQHMIFWDKVERLLQEMELTTSEKSELRRLFSGENQDHSIENFKRLIQCINNIETEHVVDFLAKATRAYINGDIENREGYFRICHILEHTLYEDLCFLRQHFNEKNMEYSLNIQGLLSNGLVYVSNISETENKQKYSFTPLAEYVLKMAIQYNENNSLKRNANIVKAPQTNLELSYATDEDIDKLFE